MSLIPLYSSQQYTSASLSLEWIAFHFHTLWSSRNTQVHIKAKFNIRPGSCMYAWVSHAAVMFHVFPSKSWAVEKAEAWPRVPVEGAHPPHTIYWDRPFSSSVSLLAFSAFLLASQRERCRSLWVWTVKLLWAFVFEQNNSAMLSLINRVNTDLDQRGFLMLCSPAS